ncbi:hypothetical protein HanRHA438_Chr09g0396681 [Helianthus annuus]|nr:hypothetical protein HanRHA438_Chr09g0396681 [Helianthus annuus]
MEVEEGVVGRMCRKIRRPGTKLGLEKVANTEMLQSFTLPTSRMDADHGTSLILLKCSEKYQGCILPGRRIKKEGNSGLSALGT